MKTYRYCVLVFLSYGLFFFERAAADDWEFALGEALHSGKIEVVDHLSGSGNILFNFPLDIIFNAYYRTHRGLKLSLNVGPSYYLFVDNFYFDLPLKFLAGYNFFQRENTSPYIYTGLSYHLAFGKWVQKRNPGIYLGGGVELFRKRAVGLMIELGYDFSTVEFKKRSYSFWQEDKILKINTSALIIGIAAIF